MGARMPDQNEHVPDKHQRIDLERALKDPGSVFRSPDDVVQDPELTAQEKLEILLQWEIDALELSVAENESMAGGEPSLLDRVARARRTILGSSG